MVCRCSSAEEHARRAVSDVYVSQANMEEHYKKKITDLEKELAALTPDATRYNIVEAVPVGDNLVLKVDYPSCVNCSFEGTKVMVFLGVTAVEALRWKEIDPHFRDSRIESTAQRAPGPDARFPPTDDGWKDALEYARKKENL